MPVISATTVVEAPPARRKSSRKISWDLVRAGCVVLVMIYHSTFLSTFLHPELIPRRVVFPYQVGASLLLVVSAYFACVTIGRGTALRYWWGRVARLLPSFLGAVTVVFVLIRLAAPEGWLIPTTRDLFTNWLMLWNWKPANYMFLDGSHWTVPLQLLGFTMAAVLYKTQWRHTRRITIIMWAALALPILQWPYRLNGPPEAYRILVDGLGVHRWHLFVAGVAIWLWSTKRIPTGHFASLLATCMIAQGVHTHMHDPAGLLVSDWGSTIGVSVGLLVLAVTAAGPDWDSVIPTWLQGRIQWFAGISYGVFLMHQTAGYMVAIHMQRAGLGPTMQVAGALLVGVLLGWALTRVVERPAHRWLMATYDRLAARRSASVTAGG